VYIGVTLFGEAIATFFLLKAKFPEKFASVIKFLDGVDKAAGLLFSKIKTFLSSKSP
jgi:hypothetical protein